MKNSSGTKEELLEEIADLKKKISKLEKSAYPHKQTKTAHTSELDFRQLAEDMPALICTFLPDSTLTYVNHAYCKLFSRRPDELVGQRFLDFLPDEVMRENVRSQYMSLTPENPIHTYEHEVILADGTGKTYWQRWTDRAFFNDDGEISHFQSIGQDITESRRMDDELREREIFLAKLLDSIPIPVFYKDRDGRYLGFNKAFEIFFGATKEKLIGKTVFDINPPDLAAIYHARDTELFESGGAQQYTSQVKNVLGPIREVIFNKAVFTNRHGEISGQIGAIVDITERKQAEEALQRSELLYRLLVDNINDIIWTFDLSSMTYTFISPAAKRILGYEADESVGVNLDFIFTPATKRRVMKIFGKLLAGQVDGNHVVMEAEHRKKDGTLIMMEISASALKNDLGNIAGFVGVTRDIAKRKQAEEKLRQSEEKYRNLYHHSALGIFHSTFDGRFIDVNPALAKMLGYDSPEEAVSLITSIAEQIYADPPKRNEVTAKALEAGRSICVENCYRYRDGTLWYGMLHLRIVPDQQGRPSHYEGFVEDITSRKQAEQTLRLHSEIMTNISEGIVLIRIKDGIIVYANQKLEEMFRYNAGELIGKHISILNAPGEKSPEEMAQDITSQLNEHGIWSGEVNCIRKDSAPFCCYANVSSFNHADYGDVWISVHSDITERKAMMVELESSYQQLRVLNQRWVEIEELGRKMLSAELHDEIGQNLTALGINLGILKMSLPPATDSRVYDRIEDSINLLKRSAVHMKSIMSNLRPALLDDYGLIAALHWYARESAKRTGIKISCAAEELSFRPAAEIETALFRIAQEAVNNAVKHARAKRIRLTLKQVENRLSLVIADNGIGFEMPLIPGQDSHGWGLRIINERCVGIKGICHIESRPGRGTKISIEVPL